LCLSTLLQLYVTTHRINS